MCWSSFPNAPIINTGCGWNASVTPEGKNSRPASKLKAVPPNIRVESFYLIFGVRQCRHSLKTEIRQTDAGGLIPVWIFTRCSLEVNWSLTVNTWPFSISLDLGSLVRTLWVGFPQARDCSARTSSLSGMSVSCWISWDRMTRTRTVTWTATLQAAQRATPPKYIYFKCELLSVVEEHEDGHLEGGHLQDVLPGVGASYLRSSYSKLRPILLSNGKQDTWLILDPLMDHIYQLKRLLAFLCSIKNQSREMRDCSLGPSGVRPLCVSAKDDGIYCLVREHYMEYSDPGSAWDPG